MNSSSPMKFLITENMLGNDFSAIKRCYDLKGSLFNREVKLDTYNQITGETGLKVLKDVNFKDYVTENQKIVVSDEKRKCFLEILKEDSKLLMKHGLMDYSVFILEIDR
jgi:hypothetical protein